ncbi:MAG: OmpA family protein [Gemmatimonadota bacterium]
MRRMVAAVCGIAGALVLGSCGKKAAPVVSQQVEPDRPPPPSMQMPATDTAAERRAREAEAARADFARIRERLEAMVFYPYDRADLDASARATLEEKSRILSARPDMRLRIEGHADERGSVEYNLALSLRRAETARNFMVDYGVDRQRIEVVPFGEERPLDNGTSEAAYARNRRAEFIVLTGLTSER